MTKQNTTSRKDDFTEGSIPKKMIAFMLPVLGALILQAMYGAVDMLIVGRFSDEQAISAVATGTNIINLFNFMITGLTMGMAVLIGQYIGERRNDKVGKTIGGALALFGCMAAVLTIFVVWQAPLLAKLMQAPAIEGTVTYVRICGAGLVFIFGYNILSGIFRGMGNSRLPLIFVSIACVVNIIGDLVLVAALDMGVSGAAIATVGAQAISVLLSLLIIKKIDLPFTFSIKDIRFSKQTRKVVKMGAPIATQDVLSNFSFLVICAIINDIGLSAGSGYGIAQKVIMFIMLIPSSLMQSMAAFVSQNIGAKKPERAKKAMLTGMIGGASIGILISVFIFFFGELPASLFTEELEYQRQAAAYLRGFAIDTTLTCILFSFIGYFNGCGKTFFVMCQGVGTALLIRMPASIIMKAITGGNLTFIGMAVPISTIIGITTSTTYYLYLKRKESKELI
ncbi:MAG: MATE family efflux transporter [Ruminococcaceae bacterium]|nr:MATE family efflux transporter [Oscillospiraceae bacterium]